MDTLMRATRWRSLATLAVVACGLVPSLVVNGQSSVLPEVQVTPAGVPDYEFDSGRDGAYCPTCNGGDGNNRLVFTDQTNQVWVAHIDPQTGFFLPSDGRGTLVGTRGAAATDYGNGPEWIETPGGAGFVYTYCDPCMPDPNTVPSIAVVTQSNGVWQTQILPNSQHGASPDGTKDKTDPNPPVNYVNDTKTAWYYRRLGQPAVEIQLPLSAYSDGNSRRWVPGTHQIIFQGHVPTDTQILRDQVFLYDIDTGSLEQLTDNPDGVVSAFMWKAPEFNNEYVFMTMAKGRQQILVYRKLPGADGVRRWTIIKTIQSVAALPFFFSPEPFTHNGKSYIFTEVSSSSRFFDRTIPNQIAMSGVNPLVRDFRLLTNDTNVFRLRLDPEYYITAQGPFIYYNRLVPETAQYPAINDGVWRVDTGLGPPR